MVTRAFDNRRAVTSSSRRYPEVRNGALGGSLHEQSLEVFFLNSCSIATFVLFLYAV
jgi:hypothetical protein